MTGASWIGPEAFVAKALELALADVKDDQFVLAGPPIEPFMVFSEDEGHRTVKVDAETLFFVRGRKLPVVAQLWNFEAAFRITTGLPVGKGPR